MKIIVVGINHAGTSMIRTLLEQNSKHDILAFDRNDNISFLGCGIALSVSGVVKNTDDLFYSNPEQLKNMGAKIMMNTDVTKIDQASKKVHTLDLKTNQASEYSYDKLIYAAGSWPIELCAENGKLKNIEVCKLFQHAETLIQRAKDPSIKKVTIIGAGYIGVELVEAYKGCGKEVTLLDLKPRVLANYVDKDISDVIETELLKHKVNVYMDTQVIGYEGTDKVNKIITSKGAFDTDMVIECIGFKPNHELLTNVEKVRNNAIKVNEYCQTSDKDIYAIGDSAAFFDAATKTYRQIALATNAVKSGIVAACHLNGINQINMKSITGTNALCVFNKKIASTGITEEMAMLFNMKVKTTTYTDNDRCEFMGDGIVEKVTVKLVYEEETLRLVGAQILSYDKSNHSEWIFALSLAIQKGMNLFELALMDVYFLPHLNKPFNFVLSAILKSLGLKYFDKK